MTYAGYVEGKFTIPSSVTLSATTNAGGPTTVTVTAGSYYPTTFAATLQSNLIAQRSVSGGTWTVTFSASTGKYTIATTAGSYSITWSTAALGTLLGFSTITSQTSVTASTVCRGVWLPDCPFNVDGDLAYASTVTDHRGTEGPTGVTFGIVGNVKYRYRGARWSHVPRASTWGTDGTWEQFLKDVHLGQGHAYFVPSSKIRICYDGSTFLGASTGSYGWYMKGLDSVDPQKVNENWGGLWRVAIPEIVSDGS